MEEMRERNEGKKNEGDEEKEERKREICTDGLNWEAQIKFGLTFKNAQNLAFC